MDDCGKIYISGWGGNVNATFYGGHGGNTSGLPITTDAFQSNTDGSDFYVAVLASKMDTLLYASYFGGDGDDEHVDGGTSRFDKRAVMYQSVCGACGTPGNFPTTTNAWSTDNKGLRRDFDTKSQQYFLDSNSHGCNNLLFKVDLSIPDLKADFDAPTHGCSPFFVTFTNKTLNAKTYLWDFGDGTTSKLRNPLPHKYAFGGIYNVVLTVTNYYSCTVKDSVPIKIQAYYKSKPNFSYEKDTCNHLVSFDTTGTNALAETLFWKFGDNDTASGPAPKHYYKNAGKYKVTLITDKGTPCSDSSSQIITLNKSDFGFALDTCSKTITVNYLYVRDSDFLWIIDGQIFKNKYPTYTFKGSGNQSIKLVIRPKAPCDTITKIVTFPPLKKPVARFVFDTCTRTATITGFTPNDSTPIWIFGKDTLRVKYPSYTFSKSGLDSFTLILPHYCKGDTARLPIYIPPKNKASFTYVNPPCTRDYAFHPLMFDPKYHWDFGDGFTDTLVNPPKHTYISDTTYMVTFIINAGKQCADTAVKFVTPKRKKDAAFSFVIDSCTGEVYFMNKTDTGAKQFLWDFGDQSNRETDRNINHFYSKEGDYTVTLLSEPGTTCADTAKNTFKMEGIGYDHLLIPNVMTPDGDGKNDVFSVSGINDKCIDFQLEIFNRWGQLVYKQYGGPGQILVWDGTSLKGDALAAGVYYWILTGKAIGQKEGTVTLVR